jgi:putative selenate reductase molybdopterin-binding subunit
MDVLSNTGAYGTHSLTVLSNVGSKTLPLYNLAPDVRFVGKAVYTNLPVCRRLPGLRRDPGPVRDGGRDRPARRRARHGRARGASDQPHPQGGTSPIFKELGEGREGVEQTITSCALPECIEIGAERIGWAAKRGTSAPGRLVGARRRDVDPHAGIGHPARRHGRGQLQAQRRRVVQPAVGATDLGTGSDTMLAQIAAEVLGSRWTKVIVTSSDTDLTPFDTGAYASSTTYVSGMAVRRAALDVRGQIVAPPRDAQDRPEELRLADGASRPGQQSVTLEKIALRALYGANQHQIAATASCRARAVSPPPVPRELRRGGGRPRHGPHPDRGLRRGRRLRHGDQPATRRRPGRGRDRQRNRLRPDGGPG